ncbi:glycosyltransferase family 39 protein [Pseudolabrys sp. FHR47]|uniref:ArnT family glycosyltransferase n=1 Tax=Pseudolabrys sp. FHR47 TaxID=2562284 RepID=UPI0010BE34E2|nr:glycosyltransferase family 39 protein [Pseudolabrys sp. FHR47]
MSTTTDDAPSSPAPARGLSAVLDAATATHARAIALLLVVSLLAFLPGFFQIPPVDRDEARFAQASKQMLERGEYVDIRFQDEVRYKKPVGIYWLQVASVKAGEALGVRDAQTTIWLYRIPSLLGAIGAVLVTYWAALAFVARRTALLAALMMATSILLGVEARLAKTDAMLLFMSVAAMGALARIYLTTRRNASYRITWRMPALLWTAIAGGVLIKGPLVLMFVVLTMLALGIADRSVRWMREVRPLTGFLWMLLLVAPWFIAIVMRSGDDFFMKSVGDDMLSKVTSGQEAHGAPPGYYFLLFWITFWPGSVLAGLAAPTIWKARAEPGARFLLAWVIPSWIVFEVVMTKLPHYVLPLYPAIAILIAGIVEKNVLWRNKWIEHGTIGWFLLPSAIAIAVPIVFVMMSKDLGLIAWPFAAAAAIFGLFAWWLFAVDGPERALLRGMVSSIFIAITVFAVTFPMLPSLFPSQLVAREVRAKGCVHPQLASTYNYQEPSLVFLLGTETKFTDGPGAAEFLHQGPCRFALIDSRSERAFVQRANALNVSFTLGNRIDGFNISNGKRFSMAVFYSAAP